MIFHYKGHFSKCGVITSCIILTHGSVIDGVTSPLPHFSRPRCCCFWPNVCRSRATIVRLFVCLFPRPTAGINFYQSRLSINLLQTEQCNYSVTERQKNDGNNFHFFSSGQVLCSHSSYDFNFGAKCGPTCDRCCNKINPEQNPGIQEAALDSRCLSC